MMFRNGRFSAIISEHTVMKSTKILVWGKKNINLHVGTVGKWESGGMANECVR